MHGGITSETGEVAFNIPGAVKVYMELYCFHGLHHLKLYCGHMGLGNLISTYSRSLLLIVSQNHSTVSNCWITLCIQENGRSQKNNYGHIPQDHLQQSTIAIPDNNGMADKFEERISLIFLSKLSNYKKKYRI